MEAAIEPRCWSNELLIMMAFVSASAVFAAAAAQHPLHFVLLFVAAILALLIFSHPMLGVWLILLLTPFEAVGPISSTQSKGVKLGLILLTSIALLPRRTTKPGVTRDPYRWPFAVMLISGVISSLLARSPFKSLLGFVSIGTFVLCYTCLRRSGVLAEKGATLLRIVIWSAVALTGLCFAQLTSGYEGFLGSAELRSVAAGEYFSTVWPGIWRASATFNGPNAAGAFFAIAGLAALIRAVVCSKLRWLYMVAAVICLGNLLMTFSRGALLGYLCGLLFAGWQLGGLSRKRLALLAVLAAVFLGTGIFNESAQKYLRIGLDLASVSPERMDAWHATRILVRRNPVFGIGFYQFRDASRGIVGVANMPLHPHNGLLKALLEQGPLGACGYLLFLLTFMRTARRRDPSGSAESRWVLGTIAGTGVCLFTQEFFDANFTIGGSSIAILFACMLAIQAGAKARPSPIQLASA